MILPAGFLSSVDVERRFFVLAFFRLASNEIEILKKITLRIILLEEESASSLAVAIDHHHHNHHHNPHCNHYYQQKRKVRADLLMLMSRLADADDGDATQIVLHLLSRPPPTLPQTPTYPSRPIHNVLLVVIMMTVVMMMVLMMMTIMMTVVMFVTGDGYCRRIADPGGAAQEVCSSSRSSFMEERSTNTRVPTLPASPQPNTFPGGDQGESFFDLKR